MLLARNDTVLISVCRDIGMYSTECPSYCCDKYARVC